MVGVGNKEETQLASESVEKKNGLGFGFSHRQGGGAQRGWRPQLGLANIGGASYCRITSGEDVLWWLFARGLSVDQRRFENKR